MTTIKTYYSKQLTITPGDTVAITTGRRGNTDKAIVLEVSGWTNRRVSSWEAGGPWNDRRSLVPKRTGKGKGIAVAVETYWGWVPAVVNADNIRETWAQHLERIRLWKERHDREQRERDELLSARKAKWAELMPKLNAKVDRTIYDHDFTVRTNKLTITLDELETLLQGAQR